MFIKFLDHDLRYGIGNSKKRILLTFLMFAFLALYHFFTLRIFQITNPEYFNSPVTTADYFLSVVGGYGKPNLFSDGTSDYSVPSVWLVFILWIMFINLYYPFKDLDGIGKHLIVLSGSRGVWWLSKCVWTIINTVINYLTVFVSCTFVGLIFGAKLSMQSNYYLYRTLNIDESSLTSSTVWNTASVFIMIGFSLIVLSLLQLLISLLAKPMISFFLMAALIFAATFKQNPLLFANYALGARNSTLVTTGLSNPLGIIIGAWIILLSVTIGFFVFQYRDIIGSDN